MLTIAVPLRQRSPYLCGSPGVRGADERRRGKGTGSSRSRGRRCCRSPPPRDRRLPRFGDPAGDRPGALDPARGRGDRQRPDARARHLPLVRGGGRELRDLYEVGTSAIVHRMIRVPDGTLRILVQGIERIRLDPSGRPSRISRASSTRSRTSSRRTRRRKRSPERSRPLLSDHLDRAVSPIGAAPRRCERRHAKRTRLSDRLDASA